MIKNERQYKITKAQAEKFASALASYRLDPSLDRDLHPLLRKAQEDALESQLADLESELQEYDALKAGQFSFDQLGSIADLPKTLIRARIARGMSQRELADLLGLKEQQIQRYEATDYEAASLSRIREVAAALGADLGGEPPSSEEKRSIADFLRELGRLGLPRDFALRRLLPHGIPGQQDVVFPYSIAALASRIFGWDIRDLLGTTPLRIQPTANVRFKVAANANHKRVDAYTVYAHYLALLAGQASAHLPRRSIPEDPLELRNQIIESYGSLTLDATIRSIWDLGIPVIPLDDSGAFHGACFREGGRNLIVLKQKSSSESRWIHDALHEIWHASREQNEADRTVLEPDETSDEWHNSEEERTANQFAGAVLLAGRGQELAHKCLARANNDLQRLKNIVVQVASEESVPSDALANYLAFRLADEQNTDWWGTASNLQTRGNPWGTVRTVFFERADFSRLAEADREILSQALAPWEEGAR